MLTITRDARYTKRGTGTNLAPVRDAGRVVRGSYSGGGGIGGHQRVWSWRAADTTPTATCGACVRATGGSERVLFQQQGMVRERRALLLRLELVKATPGHDSSAAVGLKYRR